MMPPECPESAMPQGDPPPFDILPPAAVWPRACKACRCHGASARMIVQGRSWPLPKEWRRAMASRLQWFWPVVDLA